MRLASVSSYRSERAIALCWRVEADRGGERGTESWIDGAGRNIAERGAAERAAAQHAQEKVQIVQTHQHEMLQLQVFSWPGEHFTHCR